MQAPLSLFFAALTLSAQSADPPPYPPTGAPVFAPDNKDGVQVAPNPRIRTAWLRPVHWKPGTPQIRLAPGAAAPTAAERAQIVQTLNTVSAALQATPEGAHGAGFWVNEPRGIYAVARGPLEFEAGFYPFYHEDVLEANGQWSVSRTGETESAYFRFNRLPGAVGQPVVAKEDRGRDAEPRLFYLRPRETQRVGGLPVYESAMLVAARAGRDPWAPVPLGRLWKALLPAFENDAKTAEQRLAGYQKKNTEVQAPEFEHTEWERFEKNNGALKTTRPGNYEARKTSLTHYIQVTRQDAAAAANPQRGDAKGAWYWNPVDALADARQRLASLAPAEAAQPACWAEFAGTAKEGRYQVTGIVTTSTATPGCRPVVMDNAEYFDAKPGRAAAQILTLAEIGRCVIFRNGQLTARGWGANFSGRGTPPHGCYRHVLMWRELDWAKIAGLLAP